MTETSGDRRRQVTIDELRAAAAAGDPAAQLDLADRHWFGDGVKRDPEAAYGWMRKAAEAGLAEAQSKVGFFLTYGFGVAPDPKGALRWFLKGLRGGYAKAGYNLGDAYWKGSHVTRSPRRAWFFFSKAVELGQEAAHYGLAALTYKGLGVPRDVPKSLDHLRRALRSGDTLAIVEVGRLFRCGDASPEDLAEAEARALTLHRPGDLDSLRPLFELRREATPLPPRPPSLDAVLAELDRRQAIGREPNPPELDEAGLAALREKAGAGDAESAYLLGRVLLCSARADHPAALEALLAAAEAGHAAAAFHAGTLLFQGWGVPQDEPRAVALLERAARAGNADAARFLGLAFDGHMGAPPRPSEEGLAWWREAARLGDRHACGYLERLATRELEPWDDLVGEQAVLLLRLFAVRGDQDAARSLARTLRRLGGRERVGEAAYWLRKASRRDPAAARLLGQLYGQELGGDLGDTTATAWLALAAEESGPGAPDGEAATTLAQAFLDGRGVPCDPALAILLTERAARVGFGPGARLRGEIAEDGLGVPPDAALATEWYRRAAELGDRTAMVRLAYRLFDGTAVAPDAREAFHWLERGVTAGETEGCSLLAVMLFRGEGTDPDPARARRLFVGAGDISRLPALFTSLEDEALRFRRVATEPRDLKRQAAEAAADPASISADAALEAGLLIWNGEGGLVVDEILAAELFRAAAEKGNALAAACLSHALRRAEDGEGEAEWLERAADAGLAGAKRHLAYRLVRKGRARYRDARILALLESAAEANDAVACHQVAQLLERSDAPDDGSRGARILELRRRAKEAGCWPEPPAPA